MTFGDKIDSGIRGSTCTWPLAPIPHIGRQIVLIGEYLLPANHKVLMPSVLSFRTGIPNTRDDLIAKNAKQDP
jgi:hypothetical protein